MGSRNGTSIECVLAEPARLGECPLWSPGEERLYWIDIDGRRVHRFDPVAGVDEHRDVAGRPGSLALAADPGRLLVAVEHELVWLDWTTGSSTPWVALEPPGTGNRLNDGRTDRAGRFWVGSMYADTALYRFSGALHRVDPEGRSATVRDGIGISNGLAFSPDGSVMYFADTSHDTVWAYDYDEASGAVHDERVFLDFSELPGRPDGACVDTEGCYWIACVFGWAVARVTPEGVVDRIVEVPVEKPTMPAFGGPDLGTLYVTSIGSGGTDPASPDQAEAGRLLAIDGLGVSGVAETKFGRPVVSGSTA